MLYLGRVCVQTGRKQPQQQCESEAEAAAVNVFSWLRYPHLDPILTSQPTRAGCSCFSATIRYSQNLIVLYIAELLNC
jgi:hypothetical protein